MPSEQAGSRLLHGAASGAGASGDRAPLSVLCTGAAASTPPPRPLLPGAVPQPRVLSGRTRQHGRQSRNEAPGNKPAPRAGAAAAA